MERDGRYTDGLEGGREGGMGVIDVWIYVWVSRLETHSSILAWRIPGTEEPSGLPSVGSHRVGHD